jgi:hypothetical protein
VDSRRRVSGALEDAEIGDGFILRSDSLFQQLRPCGWWGLFEQCASEGLELRWRALRADLYGASAIANPATHAEAVRQSIDERPETNPLNATSD